MNVNEKLDITKEEIKERIQNLESNIMCLSCKDSLSQNESVKLFVMEKTLDAYRKAYNNGNYRIWWVF